MRQLSEEIITTTPWNHHSPKSISADLALLSDEWLDEIAEALLGGDSEMPIEDRIALTHSIPAQLEWITQSIDMGLDRDGGSICQSCQRVLDHQPETEMCSECEVEADEVATSDADGRKWWRAQQ